MRTTHAPRSSPRSLAGPVNSPRLRPTIATATTVYQINTEEWKEGENLDFSRADAVDTALLNGFLWRDRKGDIPMPVPQHNVFPQPIPAKLTTKDLD
jgi:hypothetical protein